MVVAPLIADQVADVGHGTRGLPVQVGFACPCSERPAKLSGTTLTPSTRSLRV